MTARWPAAAEPLGAPNAVGALAGHVSVVTGGNSGIGLAIATALSHAGADVAVVGRDQANNRDAARQLTGTGAGRALAMACDVGDGPAIRDAIDGIRADLGPIHSLFVSAAVPSDAASFLEMSDDEWHRVLQVNLYGAFHTIQSVAAHMVEDQVPGSLVGIASLAAVQGQVRGQNYAASKAGLAALMRSCAVELARYEIRANTILPGSIRTPMSEPYLASERYAAKVIPRIPLRRSGEPSELGGLAVYLAGPWSSYHTGDTLVVDGGYSVF